MEQPQRYECGICGCHTYDRSRCTNCASRSMVAITELAPPPGAHHGETLTPLYVSQHPRLPVLVS